MMEMGSTFQEEKEESITMQHVDRPSYTEKDLLVVGPGVLGRLIADMWMKEFPSCHVIGKTKTHNNHDELRDLGIKPILRFENLERLYPYVVFCAPPGTEDYAAEVRAATHQWNKEGVFLFTSSSVVYDCSDNGICNEDTKVVPLGRSARSDVILRAEEAVLEAEGTIVRFVGLYKFNRGPHFYWLNQRVVDARPDHILNLIHYEDAASLCITILKGGPFRRSIFTGCDNCPLSRQEIMDAVKKSGKFEDNFVKFTGIDGPLGKRINNRRTRCIIGWQSKYPSFLEFLGVQ